MNFCCELLLSPLVKCELYFIKFMLAVRHNCVMVCFGHVPLGFSCMYITSK